MTQLARQLTESVAFRGFIISVIVFAGVLVGMETSPDLLARHGPLLHSLDRLVLGIFLAEITLRLVAHGRRPLDFFRDGWNAFDCLVVVFCLLPATGPFAAVFRLARILRLLRLVTALPKLQLLVGALFKSLSAMGYVSLLLALLFYIYAVVGVHLFGRAVPEEFGTLPAAFITLFRVVTLDNWGDSFNRVTEHVSGAQASAFFVTFIVFGTMIILNLFIGIIMNSMSEAHAEQERQAAKEARKAMDAMPTTRLQAQLDQASQHLDELRSVIAELRSQLGSVRQEPVPFEHNPCPTDPPARPAPSRARLTSNQAL